MIRELCSRGAVWEPKERYEVNSFRKALYEMGAYSVIELLKFMYKSGACSEELVTRLLTTPRMKQQLAMCENEVHRTFGFMKPKKQNTKKRTKKTRKKAKKKQNNNE